MALTAAAIDERLPSSWVGDVDLQTIERRVGTPVFIYSERQLLRNVERIHDAAAAAGLRDRTALYVPFFPNSNPHVLAPLRRAGVGVLLQIPSEHEILRRYGFEDFIVSPGHVSDEEIGFWARLGYPTFLSSLDEVEYMLRAGAPTVTARIDGLGSGKPGIKLTDLDALAALLRRYDRSLDCFEVYTGSGNSRAEMIAVIETMFSIFAEYFPSARAINFAGGHGFVYEEWEESRKHFDWREYFGALRAIADRMRVPEHVRFLFEPARDVLADTGALLMSVKRNVITHAYASLVVTDGSRMLIPSAQLRDRRHNVVFLDAAMNEIPAEPASDTTAALRGRTILRHDYLLPGEYAVPSRVDAESHVLVMDVGAYCATQHMEFLNVPPAAEVLVDVEGRLHLITARGGALDKWRHLLPDRQELCA